MTFPNNISFDDILISGDSFCACRAFPNDWPRLFAEKITKENAGHRLVRGKGMTGASWWSTRKNIIAEIQSRPVKILICTHTEMQRIPHDEDYGLNSGSAFNIEAYANSKRENKMPIEVLQAAQEYYTHLFCKDYHTWAQQKWFEEIDTLVKMHNIPYVLHLHTFMPWDSKPLHIFKNGITFDKALWPNSDDYRIMNDKPKKTIGRHEVIDANLWEQNPTRNHFTEENNIKFAEILVNAVQDYKNGIKELQL